MTGPAQTDRRELDFAPTVPSLLARAVRCFGGQEFLVDGSQRLTFAEAEERSARLAIGLLALGVGKGTRVGVLMPNGADWVLGWLAAARLGALTVPISTFYQARELVTVLRHADVQVLLAVDAYLAHDYMSRLEEVPGLAAHEGTALRLPPLPYLRQIVMWGSRRRSWALRGPDQLLSGPAAEWASDRSLLSAIEAEVTPADDLMVIYTSGSTSAPKAVVHTHNSAVRLSCAFRDSGWLDLNQGDRLYSGVPFFWVGGHNSCLLPALYSGACLIMSPSPDPDSVLDMCARESVTGINAWTSQLRALMERSAARGITLPKLRSRLEQMDADGERIPLELVPNVLGMTETFGPHSLEARGTRLPTTRAGAFGRAMPGIERIIVDPTTGERCPTGVPGELRVRGYSLMRGMYKKTREDTFDASGFYATGDVCRLDTDGYLYFEGRLGEMIKSSGANVSPREVELVLESWPEVKEAVVIGVPDERRGEAVAAVVVLRGSELDREALHEFLRSQLSHFKVPRYLITLPYDHVPRAAAGKVQKHALRDMVLASPDGLTPLAG